MPKRLLRSLPYFWLFLSVGLTAFDKLTKNWAIHYLPLRETVPIFHGLILHLCYNPGIGFSLLAHSNTLIILIKAAILVSIVRKLFQSYQKKDSYITSIGFSLILGGGFGNLYDHLTTGAVIDFISIYLLGCKMPVFNFADIFISTGILLIVITELTLLSKSN